jgi:plasmid stabilization system protein ParE
VRWRLHEAADAELLEAAKWYDAKESGLGEQFVDEYQKAIERILQSPTRFPKLETVRTKRTIRRCLVKRFPYYVAYEIVGDLVTVLAIAHTKRQPNYWIRHR